MNALQHFIETTQTRGHKVVTFAHIKVPLVATALHKISTRTGKSQLLSPQASRTDHQHSCSSHVLLVLLLRVPRLTPPEPRMQTVEKWTGKVPHLTISNRSHGHIQFKQAEKGAKKEKNSNSNVTKCSHYVVYGGKSIIPVTVPLKGTVHIQII